MRRQCVFLWSLLIFWLWPERQLTATELIFWAGAKTVSFDVLASDSSSCRLPFNRMGNLIVLKAKVDTTEGNFILDTGAPHLVLNLTYFRDYPFETQSDGQQTSIAGRGDFIYKTKVRELSFGSFRFPWPEADLTNLGNIENTKGFKVLGLLGLELFRQCELFIDFEKSIIYLFRVNKKQSSPDVLNMLSDTSRYTALPVEFVNNRMVAITEVAGKKLKLMVDCAAESSILDSRLSDKILEAVTITRRVKLTGPGDKKVDALYGNLATIKLGSKQIDNLPVVVVNLAYTCFNDDVCINGVLGFDSLSQHRIGFNFVNRKMYIWK